MRPTEPDISFSVVEGARDNNLLSLGMDSSASPDHRTPKKSLMCRPLNLGKSYLPPCEVHVSYQGIQSTQHFCSVSTGNMMASTEWANAIFSRKNAQTNRIRLCCCEMWWGLLGIQKPGFKIHLWTWIYAKPWVPNHSMIKVNIINENIECYRCGKSTRGREARF